jgi:hypothetical protein
VLHPRTSPPSLNKQVYAQLESIALTEPQQHRFASTSPALISTASLCFGVASVLAPRANDLAACVNQIHRRAAESESPPRASHAFHRGFAGSGATRQRAYATNAASTPVTNGSAAIATPIGTVTVTAPIMMMTSPAAAKGVSFT